MENLSIFDLMPGGKQFKPEKSTDWKWKFSDYPQEKNGLKVFSCFACGGGSTMGYKLAGCEVLGCVEIDPKMNEVYVRKRDESQGLLRHQGPVRVYPTFSGFQVRFFKHMKNKG